MNDEDDSLAKEAEAYKKKIKAAPKAKPSTATPPDDLAEREQLIVLASRIEAGAVALEEAQQRGEDAHRKRLAELEHLFNGRHEKLIAGVRDAFTRAEQQQASAFNQWGQRLTELESTNRLLAKIILAMGGFLMALLAWEFLR